MKILLIGAGGFLGSWITRELSSDFEIHAVIRPDSEAFRIENIPNIQIKRFSHDQVLQHIDNWKPDVVISCDWWGVANEFRNDQRQFENVSRLIDFAHYSVKNHVKVFIGVGSQAELGPVSGMIHECAADNPTTLYGSAKCQSRNRLTEIFQDANCRFVWLRVFSTYGATDKSSWFIPDLIESFSSEKVMKMTLGEQTWSYLHAFDAARAFRIAVENTDLHGIVNLGNETTITIREVALMVQNLFGVEDLIDFGAIPYRQDQVMSLMPDCNKLRKQSWRPLVNLRDGLDHTIRWTHGHDNNYLKLNTGKKVFLNLPSKS